jgi:hypothetical protein
VVAVEEPTFTKSKKWCGRSGVQQRACLLLFFTWRGLSTVTFTGMFWDIWEESCDKEDWNFGATTTGSIMTTHPPAHPWKQNHISPHLPYLLDLAPCDFSVFAKLKMKLKGWRFETVSDVQRELQAVLNIIMENDFHSAFEAWKKKMGSLYTFPRRLFWMRWQPKLSTLSHHFFFDLLQELSNITLYVNNRRQHFLIKKTLTHGHISWNI